MGILSFFRARRRQESPAAVSRTAVPADRATAAKRADATGGTLAASTAVTVVALERPLVTEKAMRLSSRGHYVFRVAPAATKGMIRRSVAQRFGVHVVRVRTITVPGKERRRKGIRGVVPGYRKALVTIQAGETIDVSAPGMTASPARPALGPAPAETGRHSR